MANEAAMAARTVIQFYEDHGGEKAWTQGEWARDIQGKKVPHRAPEAVCWCIDGAVGVAIGWQQDEARILLDVLNKMQCVAGISGWNDDPKRTYRDVINLLQRVAVGD